MAPLTAFKRQTHAHFTTLAEDLDQLPVTEFVSQYPSTQHARCRVLPRPWQTKRGSSVLVPRDSVWLCDGFQPVGWGEDPLLKS